MRDVEVLFDAGLDCLGAGDWEGAILRLREALALDPGHRDAAHGLMRALDQAGRGEEAAAVALALIANAPDDVLARTGLSMIYQRMGRVPEAEKAALEAKLLGWKMELAQESKVVDQPAEVPTPAAKDIARLYVASSNAGKLRDFASASGGRVRLEALPGLREIPAPEEDRDTFLGNAELKARFYSGFAPGEIVVADDSGLEVDAIGGRPGVRSARFADDVGFAGPRGMTLDERNNHCLMGMLLGQQERGARYRCALVAARDGLVVGSAVGSVEGSIVNGSIVNGPRGTGGFGYDPLFLVEQFGRTMAELDAAERLRVSHRGRALRALLDGMEAFAIPAG